MKTKIFILGFSIAFLILILNSCDFILIVGDGFDYELRGIWESNDKSQYDGRLEIGYNRIMITGFYYDPYNFADSTQRPFRNFIKNIWLRGYSQNNEIFIDNAGNWSSGIPYSILTSYFGRDKFLRFNFGGRTEIMQKMD